MQVSGNTKGIYYIKLNLSVCVCVCVCVCACVSVCVCVRLFSIQICSFGPIGVKIGMRHPWGTGQSKVRLATATTCPKASGLLRVASLC